MSTGHADVVFAVGERFACVFACQITGHVLVTVTSHPEGSLSSVIHSIRSTLAPRQESRQHHEHINNGACESLFYMHVYIYI